VLVVDSSVWIDFFNDQPGSGTEALDRLLRDGEVRIVVPDLVLYEVLRGFRHERELRQARLLMQSLDIETAGGPAIALEAVQHYRSVRALGVTVRSAIDVLIAAFCIENGYALLHRDRDFHAFEQHRGLQPWPH
jgi:predicted nucleic acid-binding protein